MPELPHRLALHWFRRDLRLTDNTALWQATQLAEEVLPVYVVSDWKEHHRWTGSPRQQFLCGCLESLAGNIAHIGGRLIFRQGRQADAVLRQLIAESGATVITFNRDYDPYGRAMEQRVLALGKELGITVKACDDMVLHPPTEVLTQSASPYRVFTPYSRNWHSLAKPASVPRVTTLKTPLGITSEPAPTLDTWHLPPPVAKILPPGEKAARERMKYALHGILPSYKEQRNTPAGQTTSLLGADLRFGTLSIRELYHQSLSLKAQAASESQRISIHTYQTELAWREFYQAIIWHFPGIFDHEFDPQWRGLPWSYDEEKFRRWCQGETGFPIVDAGMRELNATGFMHNRVRMITAMFLTKDLQIDWRLGEAYFMQKLVDGENASNNGGWQWSAGTGADAAPYFRIQNPWTQTKSYDPHGAYIRQWVPELKSVPDKFLITDPGTGGQRGALSGVKGYPVPMVDHSQERQACLARFSAHKSQQGR